MKLKIKKLFDDVETPAYATDGSACFDIKCYSPKQQILTFSENIVLDTGLSFEIPEGFVLMIYSRSGQGFNRNIRLANCTGVIDSDYRGEVKVKLTCDSSNAYPRIVEHGEAIAQGMLIPVEQVEFQIVDESSITVRGSGGFGSTDKKGAV